MLTLLRPPSFPVSPLANALTPFFRRTGNAITEYPEAAPQVAEHLTYGSCPSFATHQIFYRVLEDRVWILHNSSPVSAAVAANAIVARA
jgi:hypothetical protein